MHDIRHLGDPTPAGTSGLCRNGVPDWLVQEFIHQPWKSNTNFKLVDLVLKCPFSSTMVVQ